jgi:hypothetical protein
MSKKSRVLINVGLAAGSAAITILLALIALEVYLQTTYTPPALEPFEFSPNLGWENRRSFHQEFYSSDYGRMIEQTTNSVGIRDEREFSVQKTKPRILILGDSFVFGTGLDQDDLIGRRLQEMLPEYEVISAGTVGYSSTQYLQYYEQYMAVYDPDIVVFAVYLNDFAENYYGTIFGFTKPWFYQIGPAGLEKVPMQQFALVKPPPEPREKILFPGFIKQRLDAFRAKGNKELYVDHPYRHNQAWFMLETPMSEQAQYAMALEYLVLNESKTKIERNGATFVVAYIPLQWQIDKENKKAVFAKFSDIGQFQFYNMQTAQLFAQMRQATPFNFFDFTLILGGQKEPGAFFLPDGHLNPEGTALFDQTLYAYLVQEQFVNGSIVER